MIKRLIALLVISSSLLAVPLIAATATVYAETTYVEHCPSGGFFGLPPWHKYLKGAVVEVTNDEGQVVYNSTTNQPEVSCTPQVQGINDVWKIVAAVIDILLRLASMVAVGFIVYAGVIYIISQGDSAKTKQARETIIYAVVGLGISITASAIVGFVAGRF